MTHLSRGNRPLTRCSNQPCCGRYLTSVKGLRSLSKQGWRGISLRSVLVYMESGMIENSFSAPIELDDVELESVSGGLYNITNSAVGNFTRISVGNIGGSTNAGANSFGAGGIGLGGFVVG